jgi:hypothetical protein
MGPVLPIRIKIFSTAVALAGLALLVYLGVGEEWSPGILTGTAFFMFLIVVTGSFPLPVALNASADVSTAVLLPAPFCWSPA